MKCAERFGNAATLRDLKYSQMLQLLALPEVNTESFIEAKAAEGNPVEDMTVKKFRKEIQPWTANVEKNGKKFVEYIEALGK